ncbi:MAG TPA: HD domain-containing protein [Phycisphaerae bacterium]|nr:HD domain-containing protein [Phycisphaerae bacterium]
MARIPVNQMREGDVIDQVFILSGKQLGTTSSNKLYLKADCSDATGQIHCRMWNVSREMYEKLPSSGYVQIRGRVETYQGHQQLVAENLVEISDRSKLDLTELLRKTTKNVTVMQARLKEILQSIRDPDLSRMVGSFLNDADFMNRFSVSPAAQGMHHAWLGGLLEHTLSLLELAQLICPHYPDIDRDLVLAALFFHDIGKTAELSYQFGFDYTDFGKLVGHVTIGVLWIHQRAQELAAKDGKPIRADLLMVLEHIILSHHGQPEFGAAVVPKTPEAILVNMIDNLDAKTQMALDAVAAPTEDSNWTDFKKAFNTSLYRPSVSVKPG